MGKPFRLVAGALLASILFGCDSASVADPPPEDPDPATTQASLEAIHAGVAQDSGMFRVIDGDTFELQGERFRIANIDAPETAPRARCDAEARLAEIAQAELDELQQAAPRGRMRIRREGRDQFGRTLARVSFDGEADVGEAMISRGVAVAWAGRRHDWCGG